MHSRGHFGLTLFVMSLIFLPFGLGNDELILLIIVLSAGLSSIPDLDLQYGIPHRTYTHNILFALIMGIVFGVLFGYSSGFWYGTVGFFGGFMGVMLHLLGDVMTYMGFKPFWPISQKEVALKKFRANNKTANEGFFYVGIGAFVLYIVVSTGTIESII